MTTSFKESSTLPPLEIQKPLHAALLPLAERRRRRIASRLRRQRRRGSFCRLFLLLLHHPAGHLGVLLHEEASGLGFLLWKSLQALLVWGAPVSRERGEERDRVVLAHAVRCIARDRNLGKWVDLDHLDIRLTLTSPRACAPLLPLVVTPCDSCHSCGRAQWRWAGAAATAKPRCSTRRPATQSSAVVQMSIRSMASSCSSTSPALGTRHRSTALPRWCATARASSSRSTCGSASRASRPKAAHPCSSSMAAPTRPSCRRGPTAATSRRRHGRKRRRRRRRGRWQEAADAWKRAAGPQEPFWHALLEECLRNEVLFIVSPYEADAQLVSLAAELGDRAIIWAATNDSDLVAFGGCDVVYDWDMFTRSYRRVR